MLVFREPDCITMAFAFPYMSLPEMMPPLPETMAPMMIPAVPELLVAPIELPTMLKWEALASWIEAAPAVAAMKSELLI
jgi:hypothetical protein